VFQVSQPAVKERQVAGCEVGEAADTATTLCARTGIPRVAVVDEVTLLARSRRALSPAR